ncbi:uncharacterized protein LOC125105495 [Lutra lutra]|uniref:uncharacterized protein LOC125105495 n=1 Tax=Lutra lutra TaxID=9657 RepID=UPI001FD59019|nr:uncharacterized protein LOC125105495 [Lutra lutra]
MHVCSWGTPGLATEGHGPALDLQERSVCSSPQDGRWCRGRSAAVPFGWTPALLLGSLWNRRYRCLASARTVPLGERPVFGLPLQTGSWVSLANPRTKLGGLTLGVTPEGLGRERPGTSERPVCRCCASCSEKEGDPVSVLASDDVTSQQGPWVHLALSCDLDKSCLLRLQIKEDSKEEDEVELADDDPIYPDSEGGKQGPAKMPHVTARYAQTVRLWELALAVVSYRTVFLAVTRSAPSGWGSHRRLSEALAVSARSRYTLAVQLPRKCSVIHGRQASGASDLRIHMACGVAGRAQTGPSLSAMGRQGPSLAALSSHLSPSHQRAVLAKGSNIFRSSISLN